MTELYELAKYVDAIVLFFVIYAFAIRLIAFAVVRTIRWWDKTWDALWEKHSSDHNPKD